MIGRYAEMCHRPNIVVRSVVWIIESSNLLFELRTVLKDGFAAIAADMDANLLFDLIASSISFHSLLSSHLLIPSCFFLHALLILYKSVILYCVAGPDLLRVFTSLLLDLNLGPDDLDHCYCD